ncbi:MAG: ABC transporter permease [Bacteriovorax sp.]|nr:ABC transporter permease [Bacteriovorax sp.]
MLALNKKLLRDLWLLKVQTISIAIIVIGGIAILLSSWSSYQSLKKARDDFYINYTFANIFAEFKRAPVGLIAQLQQIPGIQSIEGRILIDGIANLPNQEEPAVTRIISIPSGIQPTLNKLYLRKGRLPVEGMEAEVAIHEGFAKAHRLQPGDLFQVLIEGHREDVRVVGIAISPEYIYALSAASPLPDDVHFGVLWMSYQTLSRLAKQQDSINSITANFGLHFSPPEVIAKLDQVLKKYGALGAYTRDQQLSHMFVQDEIAQQKGTAIVTPLIFLSVAAFLIHVIFSRLIALNRAQIATLKAIGFSNWEVAQHYLKLVILMSLVGTLPGIAIGVWIGKVYSKIYLDFYHFPELNFSLSYLALGIGILSGVCPGVLGAWQSIRNAFRLVPAEAMRPPMPPPFHRTIFDKIASKKHITPMSKIIFRNMFHRPDRLLMIIVGMATALGIIVTSLSWNDMITQLLETQFQRIQREDISINFLHPVSENGLQELKKMDGVISVEGYRSVPIRIRYLNRKRELSITGWPDSTQMRQALDINLRKIILPEEGLMLGRFFHKNWGLEIGDTVEIENLEGTQKKYFVKIAGFTDEMLGLSASMKIQFLWKLLGEQTGYNMATIKADSKKINQLYIHLKDIPEISSVVLKSSMYKGFQNTMGKIIRTSTIILVTFALAIAIGVIYNSIRVNFAERSWEMASLRVIGFEKWDVFTIIFVEIAVQVVLCIIPGCFFGYWFTRLSLQGIHTETFALPVIIHPQTYIKASLFVLFSLAASSWLVYRMIDKLSLVDALKSRE